MRPVHALAGQMAERLAAAVEEPTARFLERVERRLATGTRAQRGAARSGRMA